MSLPKRNRSDDSPGRRLSNLPNILSRRGKSAPVWPRRPENLPTGIKWRQPVRHPRIFGRDPYPSRAASCVTLCIRPGLRPAGKYSLLCVATWSPRRLARAALNWMFCVRSRPQPDGPASALDLPVSAHARRDGPGCRSTGRSAAAAVRSATRTGLHLRSRRRCPASRLRPVRRPAWPGRREGKSCPGAAGRVRSGAAGTSPPAVSLAEHRVESGAGT
jgi:hypothetical protein